MPNTGTSQVVGRAVTIAALGGLPTNRRLLPSPRVPALLCYSGHAAPQAAIRATARQLT